MTYNGDNCPICGRWARLMPSCPRCGVDLVRLSTKQKDARIAELEDKLQQAKHAITFARNELADYRMRIARALGMYYSAEGHGDSPCSDEEAAEAIERMVRNAAEAFEEHRLPRDREEWHEDDGAALWWRFPISGPPYCGTPLDDDFPDYVTHWTGLVMPEEVEP